MALESAPHHRGIVCSRMQALQVDRKGFVGIVRHKVDGRTLGAVPAVETQTARGRRGARFEHADKRCAFVMVER